MATKKRKPIDETADDDYPRVPTVNETIDAQDEPEIAPYEKKLNASHWAREAQLDETLFIFWDREGPISKERFETIRAENKI